jgi:hypothetical protein
VTADRVATVESNPQPYPGSRFAQGRRMVLIGLVAMTFASLLVIHNLSLDGWDPTLYTAFGEHELPSREYGEARLGDIYLRPEMGHDGKFFFIQANDPWILHPEENAVALDRPLYRSQRMLYPVIASGGGLFTPGVIVWAMIVVNILAMGLGSVATALVAKAMGMSVWWGLAFVLNLGLINEMDIGGAGIVAAAAAFGAVAAFLRERPAWGVTLLCLAALSREATLISAVGVGIWLWRYRDDRRLAWIALSVPLGVVGLWALYLRLRMGMESGASQIKEIGLPFVGFGKALAGWLESPSLSLAVGVAMLALSLLFVRRVFLSNHMIGWAFVGFVALGLLFVEGVWGSYFDISRAMAPIITAYVLLLFAPPTQVNHDVPLVITPNERGQLSYQTDEVHRVGSVTLGTDWLRTAGRQT